MGERVEASVLTTVDGGMVAARLARSVAVLDRMLADGRLSGGPPTVGMELELDLIDPLGRPRMVNGAVLGLLGRSDVQEELASSTSRRTCRRAGWPVPCWWTASATWPA